MPNKCICQLVLKYTSNVHNISFFKKNVGYFWVNADKKGPKKITTDKKKTSKNSLLIIYN